MIEITWFACFILLLICAAFALHLRCICAVFAALFVREIGNNIFAVNRVNTAESETLKLDDFINLI